MEVKLGKLAVRHDNRTPLLTNFFHHEQLPKPPVQGDVTQGITSWGMMANDAAGDCVVATYFHLAMIWNLLASGKASRPSDDEILDVYSQLTGYDPVSGANDTGLVELDFLNQARKQGFLTEQLFAYAKVRVDTPDHLKAAMWLFDGVFSGVALPESAKTELDTAQPWQATADEPGGWGGHAIPWVRWDEDGADCVTWGQLQRATWDWIAKYLDECYALVSLDVSRMKKALDNGFLPEQLTSFLRSI